jgi:hypothetical protein
MTGSSALDLADDSKRDRFGPTDEQLEAEIAEIDRMLDSVSSWLTPRCRMALSNAREVVVRVLERRRDRWPTHPACPPPPSALDSAGDFMRRPSPRRVEH